MHADDPHAWYSCPCPTCELARRRTWWLTRTPFPRGLFLIWAFVWCIAVPLVFASRFKYVWYIEVPAQLGTWFLVQYSYACWFHRKWRERRRL